MARRKTSVEATPGPTTKESEPPKRRRGPHAGSENARRGGTAVRDKYGREHFATIGAKGGRMARDQNGADFYATIGRLGGLATRDAHGIEHYERIGRMGGLRLHKRERKAQNAEQAKQTT